MTSVNLESIYDQMLFKVIDRAGNTYAIFSDGHISGFGEGAIVFNYFPLYLALERSNLSRASACPTNKMADSCDGALQSVALCATSMKENILAADGEK